MKYSTQMINTTSHKPDAHQMNPRKKHIFKVGLLALCSIFSSAINAEFAPGWNAGLTMTTGSSSFTQPVQNGQASVFPNTNLKFYPGIILWSNEDQSPSAIESNWQALFTSEKNRKETYRPQGVYGGVTAKLNWSRFYNDNSDFRPSNPKNHKDPAYNWDKIDAIFNINAVQNEGALVVIQVDEGGTGTPNWLVDQPYDGVFTTAVRSSGSERKGVKYYRYEGPDNNGESNASPTKPAIVEELVDFHRALRDHLYATGNLDKVMFLTLGEIFVNTNNLPNDFDRTKLEHGLGVRNTKIAEIWGSTTAPDSRIAVLQSSMVGPYAPTLWEYMDNPSLGMTFPDMKMSGTNNISGAGRFTHPDGTYQKDERQLSQSIEGNGFRANTYFAPDIPNPWGYSGQSVPQTMSHVLWALSGPPKKEGNKDSGLGKNGDDPKGVMPVHNIMVSWSMTWDELNPSLSEWHEAFDTFGPAGTFAFPYLPFGYEQP